MTKNVIRLSSILILLTSSLCLSSQTITVMQNDTIFCCDDEKMIDVENDGEDDLKIDASFIFDAAFINAESFGDSKVSPVTPENMPFTFNGNTGYVAQGAIICYWSGFFLPGAPDAYIGLQKYNGSDTLWSYIKVEFSYLDENNPQDCATFVVVKESVYSTNPNQELLAGETILTSLHDLDQSLNVEISPNPASETITFKTDAPRQEVSFTLYNQYGNKVQSARLPFNDQLDISYLPGGIYFIVFQKGGVFYTRKFIKI